MRIEKPLPQFAPGSYVVVTKAGGAFGKAGAVLVVMEDDGERLACAIPGHGGVLYATHEQVAPCAQPTLSSRSRRRVHNIGRVVHDGAEGTLDLPDVEG